MSAYNYTLHFNDNITGKGENYFSFKTFGRDDDHWYFETAHHIDDTVKRVFSDLINNTHFDHPDIEEFLTTKGTIVYECITTEIDSKFVIPKPEVFKSSKSIIVCSCYNDGSFFMLKDFDEIIKYIHSISMDTDDTILWSYMISDDTIVLDSVTTHIIAMC